MPAPSTANARELLRAVLPVPQLSIEEATQVMIERLINRARSATSQLAVQNSPDSG